MGAFGSRDKRSVRRSSDGPYRDPSFDSFDNAEPFERPKKRRRLWKILAVILLTLLLLGGLAFLATYLYVDQTILKGERQGRINIMVLGVDDTATLSDTIMLVSIDTRRGEEPKAALISVPRDMYVDIDDFGSEKINAAYTFGQNNDYPGGGPALSQRTLEETFDMPIHYYVTLDFTGFRQLIDTVGGVDVEVKEAINDPFYPTPDYSDEVTFKLAAGRQHLDGETALRYARSRQTTTDFDRAARQQQILLAYRDKVLSTETLLDPGRAEEIQTTLKEHLQTDLSLREIAKLGKMLRDIPPERVTRHVIDSTNYLEASQRFGYALIPRAGPGDFSEIIEFIDSIFSQTGNTLPEAQQ